LETKMGDILSALIERSGNTCELCEASENLGEYTVPMSTNSDVDGSVLLCEKCSSQVNSNADLDKNHLYCLQGAAWSPTASVQVVAYRLLSKLTDEPWATDLLEQMYLEDDVLAWAKAGIVEGDDSKQPVDANGTVLADGDSVTLIKDLVVKGANFTAKRGTMVKNIRVGDDPSHVEGRVNKMSIMLKTCFLKRA
jgi:protein PhnA